MYAWLLSLGRWCPRLRHAAAGLVAALVLFVGVEPIAYAGVSARRVMDSLPPIKNVGDTIVRIGIADSANNSTYVMRKQLTKAAVVNIGKNAVKVGSGVGWIWWMAAIAAAGIQLLGDDLVKTETITGTWWLSSASAGGTFTVANSPCVGAYSAVRACGLQYMEQWVDQQCGTDCTLVPQASQQDLWDGSTRTSWFRARTSTGADFRYGQAGGDAAFVATRSSTTTPASSPATDNEVYDAFRNYNAGNQSDAFRDAYGRPVPEVVAQPLTPEPLTATDLNALRDALSNGLPTCGEVVTATWYELCQLAKSVGVDGAPKAEDIPDPTTDGQQNQDPTADDEAAGGEDCSAPPTCGGDPIQCAQLLMQWRTRCYQTPSDADLVSLLGPVETEGGDLFQRETLDVSDSLSAAGWMGGSQCLDDYQLDLGAMLGTVEIPFSQWCWLLEVIGVFVMVAAYVSAARIMIGGL